MTNINEDWKKGSDYETFIHRANRKYDIIKTGNKGDIIENLIRAEKDENRWKKYHGPHEKQLDKIKYYMHKAMTKYLKMKKIPPESRERLKELDYFIDRAYSSDDLMNIIWETNELTQCVKDY